VDVARDLLGRDRIAGVIGGSREAIVIRLHRFVLRVLILAWLVVAATAMVASAQRSARPGSPDDVPLATRFLVAEESAKHAEALAQIETKLALVNKTANDALDEVREMRRAVWGCAATILVSLFLQLAQLKKAKGTA
jgi:hypothetical protein